MRTVFGNWQAVKTQLQKPGGGGGRGQWLQMTLALITILCHCNPRVIHLHYESYVTGQLPVNACSQSNVPSSWYSGGCAFDPRSGHISFIEIWS